MAAALAWAALCFSAKADLTYTGVNLTGPEYGEGIYPGVDGTNYTYPTTTEVDYFMGKGMNTFRVPFAWERMQPTALGALDGAQLGLMDSFVDYATARGASVILDPHNFAAYYGLVIGAAGSPVTAADFASLWSQLADHYKGNSRVIFGLMNEPVGIGDSGSRPGGTTEDWLSAANAAISTIRSTGASNLILVPGNGYDGAWTWTSDFYDPGHSNSEVMKGVVDPLGNFAYEVHQYLDADGSGRYVDGAAAVSATIGSERLTDFTAWLRANNARGFLGEFGVPTDSLSLGAMDDMLGHVDANSDVWLGWTYWAAGPWNADNLSIEPDANGDKPQLAVLENHIATVPEPGAILLLPLGLALAAGLRRWRKIQPSTKNARASSTFVPGSGTTVA